MLIFTPFLNIYWYKADNADALAKVIYINFKGSYEDIKAITQYFDNHAEWVFDETTAGNDAPDFGVLAFAYDIGTRGTSGSWSAAIGRGAETQGCDCTIQVANIY